MLEECSDISPTLKPRSSRYHRLALVLVRHQTTDEAVMLTEMSECSIKKRKKGKKLLSAARHNQREYRDTSQNIEYFERISKALFESLILVKQTEESVQE